MFKDLNVKETASRDSIFFVCSVYQIQRQFGRKFTKEEWVTWNKVINDELKHLYFNFYDWAIVNQPELVAEVKREDFDKEFITGPKDGPTEEVLYTPLEIGIIANFYHQQAEQKRYFNANEIFDFANRMFNDKAKDIVPYGEIPLSYEFMDQAVNALYQKHLAKKMN